MGGSACHARRAVRRRQRAVGARLTSPGRLAELGGLGTGDRDGRPALRDAFGAGVVGEVTADRHVAHGVRHGARGSATHRGLQRGGLAAGQRSGAVPRGSGLHRPLRSSGPRGAGRGGLDLQRGLRQRVGDCDPAGAGGGLRPAARATAALAGLSGVDGRGAGAAGLGVLHAAAARAPRADGGGRRAGGRQPVGSHC